MERLTPLLCIASYSVPIYGIRPEGEGDNEETMEVLATVSSSPEEAVHRKGLHVAAWPVAIMLLLATGYMVIYSINVIFTRNRRMSRDFRVMWTAGFLSVPQYLIFLIPLLTRSLRSRMWPALMSNYMWVPFWNIFAVTDSLGAWARFSFEMYSGVVLAVLAMVPLNYLMPCGSSCHFHEECVRANGIGAFGYFNEWIALVYMSVAVYLDCQSGMGLDHKRTFLATVGGLGLEYLSPLSDWKNMSPYLIDWDLAVNWHGSSMTTFATVAFAFALRLPFQCMIPLEFFSGGAISFDCFSRAKQKLVVLVEDTLKCFSFVLLGHSSLPLEIEKSHNSIKALSSQTAALDAMLDYAWWQCFTHSSKLKLTQFHTLSDLIKCLQKQLLVMENMKTYAENSSAEELDVAKIVNPSLQTFLEIVSSRLSEICEHDTPVKFQDMSLAFCQLDEADKGLAKLKAEGKLSMQGYGEQVAFLSEVRGWAAVIVAFQHSCFPTEPDLKPVGFMRTFSQGWTSWQLHMQGLRQFIGWGICLAFCIYISEFSSFCIISYSFLIFPDTTLRPMILRSTARTLGAAIGFIGGNLPAWILCTDLTYFQDSSPGLVSLICCIMLVWQVTNFGSLAGGWAGYAFMLAGAWAGMEMERPPNAVMEHMSYEEVLKVRPLIFQKVADMFFAVGVLGLVDATFWRFVNKDTSSRAARAVCHHMQSCKDALDNLLQETPGTGVAEVWSQLDDAHEEAESWAATAAAEQELLFGPWPSDLANSIVSEMTSFHLFLESLKHLQQSIGKERFLNIMKEVMPSGLIACLSEYHKAVKLLLESGDEPVRLDDSFLSENSYDRLISKGKFDLTDILSKADLEDRNAVQHASHVYICVFEIAVASKRIETHLRSEARKHDRELCQQQDG